MKKYGLSIVLAVIALALLAGLTYLTFQDGGKPLGSKYYKDQGENISDYSAVFLTNGQVYFGKITGQSKISLDLTDIYYLQVNQQIQPEQKDKNETQPNIVLVKLGSELHGPNDIMHINRDQVLFFESMKKDSKVVKAINDNKSKK